MHKIIENNATTGEIIEREMNEDELAQFEKDQAESAAQIAAKIEKASAKAALLAQLGITDEQAKLLLS